MPAVKPVEPAEVDDSQPPEVGYCHQPDCGQQGVEVHLWKPLGQVPVLCQCGHLLQADAPE